MANKDEKDEAERDEANASDEDRDETESSSEEDTAEAGARPSADESDEESESKALARLQEPSSEEDEEEESAAQLGTQRYVLAAFFGTGLVGAFVVGKMLHGIWAWASNKDWFHNAVPMLAAIADEDKTTYSTILGAIIALVLVVRTYRRPGVRAWADEVATELSKVKWPTRKEVSNSTIVVIAASAVATIYLALLDRLWSFVTDLFYGTGS